MMKLFFIFLFLIKNTLLFYKYQNIDLILQSAEYYLQYGKDFIPYSSEDSKHFDGIVSIGENNFRVVYDVGACENWLQSEECSSKCHLGPNKIPQNNICTLTDQITYNDQTMIGCYDTTAIRIDQKNCIINFLSVNLQYTPNYDQSYYAREIDGVISLCAEKKKNIVNQLFLAQQISLNTFSLSKNSDGKSSLKLGIDIKSDPRIGFFFSSISKKYWILQMNSCKFNSQIFKNEIRLAVLDTSVSSILIPIKDFESIFAQLKKNNNSCKLLHDGNIECFWDSFEDHPQLELNIFEQQNNQLLILDHNKYMYNFNGLCIYHIKKFTNQSMQNVWILGEAFMNQFETLFDVEESKVVLIRKYY